MTTEQRPPEPDVLELVADVVKAWRQLTDEPTAATTIGDLHRKLNRLEKVWPR